MRLLWSQKGERKWETNYNIDMGGGGGGGTRLGDYFSAMMVMKTAPPN